MTMKIFKIILILVLLISISIGVWGQMAPDDHSEGWEKRIGIEPEIKRLGDASSTSDMTTDKTYWEWIDEPEEAKTLREWFENLTLDEKIELYNWWKYESVNLTIVNDGHGEITIRIDKKDKDEK